jgi:uncharacterized phage protein gp47/JayE
MTVTTGQIADQMVQGLALTEPDLDTSVGTTVRKMVDAVAEVIASAYSDKVLLDYQYDINAKSGSDLDDFVALFGFSRLAAKRATGSVTFSRTLPPPPTVAPAIFIPIGTQLATADSTPIVVSTMVPAILPAGQTTITVPVQAVVGGAIGNIAASSLVRKVTPLDGIPSFTNPSALVGGSDPESDDQLRTRFKKTVFRNLAGTEQMFLAIALDNAAVTQANVIGASKTWREQVQLVGGVAISTLAGARYVYPTSAIFGPNIDGGQVLTPGVHYTFTASTPPSVTSLNGATVPDGVYDLQFEYVPLASRNDPINGITNRIDLYISGQAPTEATETVIFSTTRLFNATVGDPLNVANFQRDNLGPPQAGNYFAPFAFAPVVNPSISGTIQIAGGPLLTRNVDYFLVNDITRNGGAFGSLSGVEFIASSGTTPSGPNSAALAALNGHTIVADYLYNAVPHQIDLAVRAWRLVTTDVKVHQAKVLLLNFYMAAILTPGFNLTSVQTEMQNSLSAFISNIGFNGVVQVSDLIEIAHQVPGVDSVRLLTATDNPTNYAIQQVNSLGAVITTYQSSGRATDVILSDDQLPAFNSLTLLQKAQNSFGVV